MHLENNSANLQVATFGTGCFWSTERNFRKQFGAHLATAVVGYMDETNPVEVLQISFKPHNITLYDAFVRFFFDMHDSTKTDASGNQYRSVIFTHTDEQQIMAERVRCEVQASGKIEGPLLTQIQSANGVQFQVAQPKHQNYLEKKYGWLMES